jgi:hypothetical protein
VDGFLALVDPTGDSRRGTSRESEIRDLGELTIARVRLGGHGAGSDAFVGETVWHVMEWRDGKCIQWASFRTEAEAVEAARRR